MATIDLDTENAKHIEILNREMGEVRDCIAEFKKENAVDHKELFIKLSEIDEISNNISRLGWGLAASVIILVISIVVTNLVR